MPPVKEVPSGEFKVINCGASYCLPGNPDSRRFARKGEVISLDADEEARLRDLDAVVARGEREDIAEVAPRDGLEVAGEEHAQPLQSQEEHAENVEKEIAAEKKPSARSRRKAAQTHGE
jgi:hypothetical protein